MKSIRDMFSSAMSELVLDDTDKKPEKKEAPEAKPALEQKTEPGSLSEMDRVMGMLESPNESTREKGLAELEKITEEGRLACVAVFSSNQQARKNALERISKNTDLLCSVYTETRFRDTSELALQKLSGSPEKSPKALALIASNHTARERRQRALKEINDANALLEVAYGSRFEDSRWEAIGSLKDMKIDIGKDDLRHDDTLMSLADRLIKSSAAEEEVVADMEVILENVRYLQGARGSDEYAGIIADNLSAYKRILRSTATSSKHPLARTMAVKGITDVDLLSEIAQHSEHQDSAQLAVDMIASMLSQADPKSLALVASMSADKEKREKALSKLKDGQMLKHVVKFSKYEDSRIQAANKLSALVDKIEEAETLRLIMCFARDTKGRAVAEKKVGELAGKESQKIELTLPKIEETTPGSAPEPERKAEQQIAGTNKSFIELLKELIGI